MTPDVDEMRLRAAKPSPLADRISLFGHPVVNTCLGAVLVPLLTGGVAAALRWSWIVLVFFVALPYLSLLVFVWLGKASDRQVVKRAERHGPNCVALGFVLIGYFTLFILGAPGGVMAYVTSMLAVLVLFALLTFAYKVSYHAGAVAGAWTAVACVGPSWLWGVLVAASCAMAWSRVRSGRHTSLQVVLGTTLACAVTCLCFAVM